MFARSIVVVALYCIGAASLTQAKTTLGDLVTPCSVKDEKLNECLTVQGKALLPHLVAGVKDWGILPLEPLFVPLMQLQRGGGGGPIGLVINVTNSSNYGFKDLQIKSIKLDPKNYKFSVEWLFPVYKMVGTAVTSGRFLLLPITGSGAANLTFLNVNLKYTFKCVPEKKGEKTYLKITESKADANPKQTIFKLENLFNNKQLSDTMNNFLNENHEEAFVDVKENIDEVFGGIVTSILDRMLAKVPLDQLLRDVE